MGCRVCCKQCLHGTQASCCTAPCSYSFPREVSFYMGPVCGLLQILLFVVVIVGPVVFLLLSKRYQATDVPVGAVVIKLKGVALTNFSAQYNESLRSPNAEVVDNMLFDSADYIIPPQDNGAFFVMTNMIYTHEQEQGVCAEDPDVTGALCDSNNTCTHGETIMHGIKTGKCIPSTMNPNISVCEVRAWCPVELDKLPINGSAALLESRNFQVQLRNNVLFPRFNQRRRNIVHDEDSEEFLENCTYAAGHPRRQYCPVFDVGTLVRAAGEDYDTIAVKGGVISIRIHWKCDFDDDTCEHEYIINRLDDKKYPKTAGLNFRFAYNYFENGKHKRMLIKAYGIRFLVTVTGEGRQFDAIQTFFELGALLAYAMGIFGVIAFLVGCCCINGSKDEKENELYTEVDLPIGDTGCSRNIHSTCWECNCLQKSSCCNDSESMLLIVTSHQRSVLLEARRNFDDVMKKIRAEFDEVRDDDVRYWKEIDDFSSWLVLDRYSPCFYEWNIQNIKVLSDANPDEVVAGEQGEESPPKIKVSQWSSGDKRKLCLEYKQKRKLVNIHPTTDGIKGIAKKKFKLPKHADIQCLYKCGSSKDSVIDIKINDLSFLSTTDRHIIRIQLSGKNISKENQVSEDVTSESQVSVAIRTRGEEICTEEQGGNDTGNNGSPRSKSHGQMKIIATYRGRKRLVLSSRRRKDIMKYISQDFRLDEKAIDVQYLYKERGFEGWIDLDDDLPFLQEALLQRMLIRDKIEDNSAKPRATFSREVEHRSVRGSRSTKGKAGRKRSPAHGPDSDETAQRKQKGEERSE